MAEPQNKSDSKRSIPVSKDLLYQAKVKFPGYDDQSAITLYMLDQFDKQHEVDTEQSNLITAQKQEYGKLRKSLSSIGQELDELEQESVENDSEIERLKQLINKLKPSGQDIQQEVSVSKKEAERIEKELEKLKTIPGMDSEKYNELSNKIQDIMKIPGVSHKEIKELDKTISDLQKKNQITSSMYSDVKKELDTKEDRFRKYITKKGEQFKKISKSNAEEISNYKQKIDKEFDEIKKEHDYIINLRNEIQDNANQVSSLVNYTKHLVKEPSFDTRPKPILPIDNTDNDNEILTKAQAVRNRMKKPETMVEPVSENRHKLKEGVYPVGKYKNKIYLEWLTEVLPLLLFEFRKRFRDELSTRKDISDDQIAYAIEDRAPWIWQITSDENPIVSKNQLETFLNVVKLDLFKKNLDLNFSEGLPKIYERILDNIIIEVLQK